MALKKETMLQHTVQRLEQELHALRKHHVQAIAQLDARMRLAYPREFTLPENAGPVKELMPKDWTPVQAEVVEPEKLMDQLAIRYRTLVREVRWVAQDTVVAV